MIRHESNTRFLFLNMHRKKEFNSVAISTQLAARVLGTAFIMASEASGGPSSAVPPESGRPQGEGSGDPGAAASLASGRLQVEASGGPSSAVAPASDGLQGEGSGNPKS